MAYQKYNDPAKLLLDICHPDWNTMSSQEIDDLLAQMAQLGTDMNKDKKFKHKYMMATKEAYLKYVKQQENGDYIPPLFSDLDNEIRHSIAEEHEETAQTEVLIPDYISTSPSQKLSSRAQTVKAKVALMRANMNKKINPDIIVPNQRK